MIENRAIGGRAGIGWRPPPGVVGGWLIKNQKLTKRPIREKKAAVRELKIPKGTREAQSNRGKTMSPPPKTKNFPPG